MKKEMAMVFASFLIIAAVGYGLGFAVTRLVGANDGTTPDDAVANRIGALSFNNAVMEETEETQETQISDINSITEITGLSESQEIPNENMNIPQENISGNISGNISNEEMDAIDNTFAESQENHNPNTDTEIIPTNAENSQDLSYIVGVHNGFITVFYEGVDFPLNIKEITQTPLSAVASDEADRLKVGIRVNGLNELFRVLEDYGS